MRGGRPPLADFLFGSRRGYCQHFAGSMAVMLRSLGIPARVAVGYTGGRFDAKADAWVVTDRDAHSWVEVWLAGRGGQGGAAAAAYDGADGDVAGRGRARGDEDLATAEGIAQAALASSREALVDTFVDAATDGFLDFGHGLIFVAQAEGLTAHLGAAVPGGERPHEAPIWTSLARNLVYATREHTLPPMRQFVKSVEARGPLSFAHAREDAAFDAERFFAQVVDGDLASALDAVDGVVTEGVAPTRVALALGLAAGERLLRFDPAHELDFDVSEGWLHVTHALTYAEATFQLLQRRPSETLLRALRYGARFVQHMGPLDGPPAADVEDVDLTGHDIGSALDARDVSAVRQLARDLPLDELRAALERDMLSDRLTRQIFVAHHIKTGAAALRLAEAAESDRDLAPWARRPLEATLRWLCHPMKERRIARNARIASRFVREGVRTRDLC